MTALFGSTFVGFGFIDEMRHGVVERMRVTPMSRTATVLGRTPAGRRACSCSRASILVVARDPVRPDDRPAGLRRRVRAARASSGSMLGPISYAMALVIGSEDALAPLTQAIALPLLLLSGVMLPMSLAPEWLRTIAPLNPLYHATLAIRALFNAEFSSPDVVTGIVTTGVFALLSHLRRVARLQPPDGLTFSCRPQRGRATDPVPTRVPGGMQALRSAPWQLSFVALGAIWGCSFLFIKLGLASFTPVEVAFGRLAIGATVLVVIARATGTPLPRRRSTWGHLAVVALLFCSIPFTLFAWGETQVSSILAGIINSFTPLMVLAVVLAAFPEQRPGPERVVGLGVGFVGVLVVLGAWNGLGAGELAGVAACLGAVLCYGIAFPYTRRYLAPTGEPPVAIATGQVVLGALFLVPVVAGAALAGGGGVMLPIAPSTVVGMLALGALGSGIAYLLSTRIVLQAGATTASSVGYITPLFSVLAGSLVLGEPLAWYQPVGGAVVLLGVAISQGRLRLSLPARLRRAEADARRLTTGAHWPPSMRPQRR